MKYFKNLSKNYILLGAIALALLVIGTLAYFIVELGTRDASLPEDDVQNLGDIMGVEEGDVAAIISEFIPVARATLSKEGEAVAMNRFWFEKSASLDEQVLFYVEYVNDGDKKERKILLQRFSEGNYGITAEFSKGLTGWSLESGEDFLLNKELIMYEKEENIWKLNSL